MSPPDRAAVERLIAALDNETEPRAGYTLQAASMIANLLQHLELAEQEKAEAVAQRDMARQDRDAQFAHNTQLQERLADVEADRNNLDDRLADLQAVLDPRPYLTGGYSSSIFETAKLRQAQRDEAVGLLQKVRELTMFGDDELPTHSDGRFLDATTLREVLAFLAAYDAKEKVKKNG
jgi:hypothetical protein